MLIIWRCCTISKLERLKVDLKSRHDQTFTLSPDSKDETQSLKDGDGSFHFNSKGETCSKSLQHNELLPFCSISWSKTGQITPASPPLVLLSKKIFPRQLLLYLWSTRQLNTLGNAHARVMNCVLNES